MSENEYSCSMSSNFEEELMGATSWQYLTYQKEPLVPSSEDSGEEPAICLDRHGLGMKMEFYHPGYEIVAEKLPFERMVNMQVLETIQEYAPIKHGIFLVSSLLARYHASPSTPETEEEKSSQEIGAKTECGCSTTDNGIEDCRTTGESIELNGGVVSDTRQSHHENEAETEFLGSEDKPKEAPSCDDHVQRDENSGLLSTAQPNYSTINSKNGMNSHPLLQNHVESYLNEANYSANTPVHHRDDTDMAGGKCECNELRYNSNPLKNGRYQSNNFLKEDSDFVDSESDAKELRRRRFRIFNDGKGFRFTSRSFRLSVFNRKKKRTKHVKKRGNTLTDCRLPVNTCECATGSADSCLVHTKSQSESDVNSGLLRLNEDYFADASDISLKSLSLAEDDSSSSYVDIDLFRVRNSLVDSVSLSCSDRSLELSSDWSEINCNSSSDLSVAEECRESDIPDTASDFSHDSRSHISVRQTRRQRRPKKIHLLGHNVNESFMENECCHCIVM